jgi:stress-induced morphogen
MIQTDEIKQILQSSFPDAELINVIDTTGTADHFLVEVRAIAFSGKSLIEQHRMVQNPLSEAIKDGRIHAIQIKTTAV